MLGIHSMCRFSSKSISLQSVRSSSRYLSLIRNGNASHVLKRNGQLSVFSVGNVKSRCYGSGFDENYILKQNTLSKEEKDKIQKDVDKDFEDWVPYGLDPTNKEEDIFRYKMLMIIGLSVSCVTMVWFFAHVPTHKKRDWVTREAYLELERRRQLGLPLVDKNLIPEDQILLPTMEELGDDYEIII